MINPKGLSIQELVNLIDFFTDIERTLGMVRVNSVPDVDTTPISNTFALAAGSATTITVTAKTSFVNVCTRWELKSESPYVLTIKGLLDDFTVFNQTLAPISLSQKIYWWLPYKKAEFTITNSSTLVSCRGSLILEGASIRQKIYEDIQNQLKELSKELISRIK